MSDIKKRLVFSILQFLQQSIKDGTIQEEDTEGVEVAVQCIGEAFGVNIEDSEQRSAYATKAPLLSIFEVAVKAQERIKPSTRSVPSQPAVAETKVKLTEEQKKKAEELKSEGNRKVSEKDFEAAVKLYSEAIEINGNNAVYYSNRAAAYSQLGQHHKAIEDAIKSSQIDPSYSKAYGRLGHAYFSVEQYKDAVEAYEKGLSLDPNNPTMKSALATAEQKASELRTDQGPSRGASHDRNTRGSGAGAGAGGGLGGLGGLAGLANLAAMMNMARQMMQAQNIMRGGNPPNMDEMMNDPNLANLARQFSANQGDGGGGNPDNNETNGGTK
ncbi:15803_t:CDS:10 [Funneliformis mosseae]|uniref:15803_t:CDS:1 n=1 Tax=Funneliformis mosseae TaxID=27381 RepID=A0A9N9CUF3_FUNMO|nr:15803_t:CDS:10 [Funneliformis mosseae]